jgi:hypothetical protein
MMDRASCQAASATTAGVSGQVLDEFGFRYVLDYGGKIAARQFCSLGFAAQRGDTGVGVLDERTPGVAWKLMLSLPGFRHPLLRLPG